MKFSNLLTIMALCAMLPMFSCGSDSNTETGSTDPSTTGAEANPANTPAPTSTDATGTVAAPFGNAASTGTTPATATPTPVATAGVKHYTCPKNCAGSGGDAAGTCPVCGSAGPATGRYSPPQQYAGEYDPVE